MFELNNLRNICYQKWVKEFLIKCLASNLLWLLFSHRDGLRGKCFIVLSSSVVLDERGMTPFFLLIRHSVAGKILSTSPQSSQKKKISRHSSKFYTDRLIFILHFSKNF